MITKIGIWEIDEDGLTGKVDSMFDYNIAKESLWDTIDYKGHIVWKWLIYLTEKNWVTKNNIHELNTAFFFGQDYFKNLVPAKNQCVSTAQTIFIQQQIMSNLEKIMRYEESQGSDSNIIDGVDYYFELEHQINFLTV